jgi:hypothetical protein
MKNFNNLRLQNFNVLHIVLYAGINIDKQHAISPSTVNTGQCRGKQQSENILPDDGHKEAKHVVK